MAKHAKVTLLKGLSLTVGRYRFEKDKAALVKDPAVIEALQADGSFAVELLPDSASEAAPAKVAGKVLKEPAAARPDAKTASDKEADEDSSKGKGKGKG